MSPGEETQRAHVNTHVNHSTVPACRGGRERRGGDERTREGDSERERREGARVADKWPSGQTRDDRPEAGKASDMSKREQLLGSLWNERERERELVVARASAERAARRTRANEREGRVTSGAYSFAALVLARSRRIPTAMSRIDSKACPSRMLSQYYKRYSRVTLGAIALFDSSGYCRSRYRSRSS